MLRIAVALTLVLSILGSPVPFRAAVPAARPPQAIPQETLVDQLLRFPAASPQRESPQAQRPQYTLDSPPPGDAPRDVLLRFWVQQAQVGNARRLVVPDKTRELLFEAASENLPQLPYLLELFPRTAAVQERIKRLYDDNPQVLGRNTGDRVRKFLLLNTAYFVEELARNAGLAADNTNGHVDHEEELEAFAAVDFARAETLLKRFAEDAMPRRSSLAKALLFEHYPPGPEADRFNLEARKIVEDRNAPGYSRDRVLKGLFARDWNGRDEWFLSLFKDSSFVLYLKDGSEIHRPLRQVVGRDPDRWFPILMKLVSDSDRAVHDNAVACLVSIRTGRREAVMALLPWLSDPKWSSADDDRVIPSSRGGLIQSVVALNLRESIPGLIAILSQDVYVADRGSAAEALGRFHAAEAAPALRQALKAPPDRSDSSGIYRRKFLLALVDVGGLSDTEAAAAVESYVTTQGARGPTGAPLAAVSLLGALLPDAAIIGQYLAQNPTPSETLVTLLLSRAAELEPTDPRTASQLLEIGHRWSSASGDRDLARRIAANTAPAANVRSALQHREKFRENVPAALRDSASSSGAAAGIFAVLSGDRQREEDLLKGSDIAAIRAVFASARIAGELLPFDAVERVYNSARANVEQAAESYLLANDGPNARKILNARSKGAVILGAIEGEDGSVGPATNVFAAQEQQLLAKMRDANAPDEVFALLRFSGSYWSETTNRDQIVIERRGNTATVTSQGTGLTNGSRALSAEEFGKLKAFIDSKNVEELGPISAMVSDITLLFEYVHLTTNSGRRVYMRNLGFGGTGESVHSDLAEKFFDLAR